MADSAFSSADVTVIGSVVFGDLADWPWILIRVRDGKIQIALSSDLG